MTEFDKAVRAVRQALMGVTTYHKNDYAGRNKIASEYAPVVVQAIVEAVKEQLEADLELERDYK